MAKKHKKRAARGTAIVPRTVAATPVVEPASAGLFPDVDRLFDEWLGLPWPRLFRAPLPWPREALGLKMPSVDVYEEKDEVVVKAEIPGIDKSDVEVNVTDTTVTIRGEKRQEKEIKRANYYRAERSYGSFARTVDLPAEVKGEAAKATFKDGVLEVRAPKTEAAKRSRVTVRVD